MTASFLVKGFFRQTQIRNSRTWPFSLVITHSSFSTQTSPEEATDEILNQILAANNNSPSITSEDICINHIRNLCAAGSLSSAAKLPENLRSKRVFLTPRAYDYILESAAVKNDIKLLSKVFKDLLSSSTSVRFNSYLIIARAIGKPDFDSVSLLSFVKEVCELELPRIDIVLNRLIFALSKCGYTEKALLVVGHMRKLKCKPDLVTYNTVLSVLGCSGRVEDMVSVFEFMKKGGLVPDIFTYNTVLNSLRKMGRLDLCSLYFREMRDRGIQPDSITYKALVESLGRSGNVREALKMFEEMKRKKMIPSVHIYKALIFSLKKIGDMESALKFEKEMKKVCFKK